MSDGLIISDVRYDHLVMMMSTRCFFLQSVISQWGSILVHVEIVFHLCYQHSLLSPGLSQYVTGVTERSLSLSLLKSFLLIASVIHKIVIFISFFFHSVPVLKLLCFCPSQYVGIPQRSFYNLDQFHTIMVGSHQFLERGKLGKYILTQGIRINGSYL